MPQRWSTVALLALWVLGWGVGGSLIDAGLIQAQVYSLEGGQAGTLVTFLLWSLFWGGLGWKQWRSRAAGSRSPAGSGDRDP